MRHKGTSSIVNLSYVALSPVGVALTLVALSSVLRMIDLVFFAIGLGCVLMSVHQSIRRAKKAGQEQ